jgi:hypothetical protein
MNKVAIIVLADAETPVDRGRMIHALTAVKELKDANDDVQLIFEGIGVRWGSVPLPIRRTTSPSITTTYTMP